MGDLADRLDAELAGKREDEVKELTLDNCRCSGSIGDVINDKFVSLVSLSLNDVGLRDLKGFPSLPQLRKLDLADNRISHNLQSLSGCTNLEILNLAGNLVRDLRHLEPLAKLPNLKRLTLEKNPIMSSDDDVREEIFKLIPSLVYIDDEKANGEVLQSDDEDDEEEQQEQYESQEDEDDQDDGDDLNALYQQEDDEEEDVDSKYVQDDDEEDDDYGDADEDDGQQPLKRTKYDEEEDDEEDDAEYEDEDE